MNRQRLVIIVRIVFTLMLALGVLSMATGVSVSSPALGKDKHGHNGKSHKPDKNKHKQHAAKQDKKDNGQDKGKKDKKEKRVRAEPVAQYTVRVDCNFDATVDETSCQFDADSPPGAKKINLFDVPAAELCAPVVGGDGRYVDPDPNTDVTGYRSTDSDGEMTLVFPGHLDVDGSATYWIKAASNIFPATGPGLRCIASNGAPDETSADVPSVPTSTPPPAQLTPEVTDTTGSVIVQSHTCPIASPPADYDWYGECSAQESGVRYRLVRVDTETRDGLTTSTDTMGRAQFLSLQPGAYELTQADGDWCHAQSDNVDADGTLIVNAGERTTVWVFACTVTQ